MQKTVNYRIPLNIFVVILLLKIKHLSSENVFMICALAHLVSLLCYLFFYASSKEGIGASEIQMKDQKLYHAANTEDNV